MDWSGTLGQLWPFLVIAVVVLFFKSPVGKGIIGEFFVNTINSAALDKSVYQSLKNVTLPTADGTTQIDHIVVSPYGIFVIETKNMKGWIFGGERQKVWTQQLFRKKNTFQNPLRQNYKHIKAFQELLGVDDKELHSVIVFTGDCKFKTKMPENVFRSISYVRYIKSFKTVLFSESQIDEIINAIQTGRKAPGLKTHIAHVNHLRDKAASPGQASTSDPVCPKCAAPMMLRTNKKNGDRFWGCTRFPACRGTRQL